jgi:membrane protease YdiL (CAAX protease family)
MKNIKTISLVAMGIMTILSFSNLLGESIAGASIFVGIAFFFINKYLEKQPMRDSGLDIKAIGANFKDRRIWFWMAMPLIMDIVSITISKLFLPEYIDHVVARAGNIVSFDNLLLLAIQLPVFALGEEIAWRAFFQKQLNKKLHILPALLISSVLFALGHLAEGSTIVVIYDIFFVFINSILYGVVFYKTNNAWASGISHFFANLLSTIVLVLF